MEFSIPSAHLREAVSRRMVRLRVGRLRRISARPFGLAVTAGTAVMLGDESSSTGLAEEIRAAVRHTPVRLDSISLFFGDYLDLSEPLVEVITRWDGGPAGDLPPFARELGSAVHRDEVAARGDWMEDSSDSTPVFGPFESGDLDIVVSGRPARVGAVWFHGYTAFSFPADAAEVTVVSRHAFPEPPQFDPVTDLQPFCAGWVSLLEDGWERKFGPPRPSLA